jgi:hypothetical protein
MYPLKPGACVMASASRTTLSALREVTLRP